MAKKTNLKTSLVMAVILLGFGCTIAAGGVIYVDVDASTGGDGQTWGTAYKYLQDALYKPATSGDEIWVAQGMYKSDEDEGANVDPNDRTETFQLISGVAIYGGFAGGESSLEERDWETYETILSGDINTPGSSENSYHVVTGSGTDETAVLDGFTITAGNANGADTNGEGGGMRNYLGGPTVVNCTFSGNSAGTDGGGMCNDNFVFQGGSPTVTNCTFNENWARWGGGMSNYDDSNTVVSNCIFSNNSAKERGGAMDNDISTPTITNCTFIGNTATGEYGSGGGIVNYCGSSTTLINCVFRGNSATGEEAGGGGMANWGSMATLTNCTFSGNWALYGRALLNVAVCPGGPPGELEITNAIFWDGGEEIYEFIPSSTITVTHSDVQGGYSGTGNIDADPLFIGPNGPDGIGGTADDEEDNVHLRGYSPCINAGDPGGDYSGQVDIDRQPRVAYGRVDMGADEVFPIAGDFEPDGDVDFADFAIFANHWLLGAK